MLKLGIILQVCFTLYKNKRELLFITMEEILPQQTSPAHRCSHTGLDPCLWKAGDSDKVLQEQTNLQLV